MGVMPGRNDPCSCGSGKKYKRCCAPGASGSPAQAEGGETTPLAGWPHVAVSVGLIIAAALWAFHNSFTGAFVFDDQPLILKNPHIRRLWPLSQVITDPMRPLVDLSLALNFALGGVKVEGYHAANLLIHCLAGLALFGLIRRTLATPRLQRRYGRAALGLALASALLWVVHPLTTQSVTYIIQRAESLAGMWYLVTLYSLARSSTSPHPGRWAAAAIAACALGTVTKAIIVTAPLVALLYDRIFLAGSWGEVWRRRGGLHAGLLAGWLLLAALAAGVKHPSTTAGFDYAAIRPAEYAATQPGVILHYLRLAVWPHPLTFDYDWPIARGADAVLPPTLLVGALAAATIWMLRAAPAAGFLGAWVFIILAPSSSIMPIQDVAVEHRMYLPLAGVVTALVIGGDHLMRRLVRDGAARAGVSVALAAGLTVALGAATQRRNLVYQSDVSLWKDVIAKRPMNARAYNNLGLALAAEGKSREAAPHFVEAARLKPNSAEIRYNLGLALDSQGRLADAIPHYTEAVRLKPEYAEAHRSLGAALLELGRRGEARLHVEKALRLNPDNATAHNNLGILLAQEGKFLEAAAKFSEALRLNPQHREARENLGRAMAALQASRGQALPQQVPVDPGGGRAPGASSP